MSKLVETVRMATSASVQAVFDYPIQSYIEGRTQVPETGSYLSIIDPSTGAVIGDLADSGVGDVKRAVSSARTAFKDGRWWELAFEERERVLFRLADLLERDIEIFMEVEARESGRLLADAKNDVIESAAALRYFARWGAHTAGTAIRASGAYFSSTTRNPIGVCAIITSGGSPLPILAHKAAPALAVGNSIVAKPSEATSASCVLFSGLANEAGVPPGVFNVVTGGDAAGVALARSSDIDLVVYSGSTATGKAVLGAAAVTLTPATAHLQATSVQILFEDADFDAVASGIWEHLRQICAAGSRILIQANMKDAFLHTLRKHSARLSLGDALAPDTVWGPMTSESQMRTAKAFLAEAEREGASVLRIGTGIPTQGFFQEGAIISGFPAGHLRTDHEVSCPILVIETFADEQEAIGKANSIRNTVVAGLWSENAERVHRITRKLDADVVWANGYGNSHSALLWSGRSIWTLNRKGGPQSIEHYTRPRTSIARLGDKIRT